jgi:hypothetical protein
VPCRYGDIRCGSDRFHQIDSRRNGSSYSNHIVNNKNRLPANIPDDPLRPNFFAADAGFVDYRDRRIDVYIANASISR